MSIKHISYVGYRLRSKIELNDNYIYYYCQNGSKLIHNSKELINKNNSHSDVAIVTSEFLKNN